MRTVFLSALALCLAAAGPCAGGEPPGPPEFLRDVLPLLDRLGCNAAACHGSRTGKGGLRLSLFAADPESDHAALTREGAGRRIDAAAPAESLLVLMTTGALPHSGNAGRAPGAGGKPDAAPGAGVPLIAPGSPEHRLLLAWIAAGAPFGDRKRSMPVSVRLEPAEVVLAAGEEARLRATAVFADGREEDVTGRARFALDRAGVASLAGQGGLRAEGPGECIVLATYLRRTGVARAIVPRRPAAPFPEDPAAAESPIDALVVAKLKKLGIPPAALCTDEEFLRRVHLDAIGVLPSPEEARAFLADADPRKREKLVDRLLEREEFADFWALKWGDLLRIKSEFPSNLWPNAVQAYHRWIRDSIARNVPYDRFVAEILTARGSNFRSPPSNFYRAATRRDPGTMGETAALVFLGARVGCARCHGHPLEDWTPDDHRGLAAFFAGVSFKSTGEWKEEIVYLDPKKVLRDPRTGEAVPPRLPGGGTIAIREGEDPRAAFARWLTSSENPAFARNIANRVWCWLLGRGLVQEPDDLRPTNPPENPELLDFLAHDLAEHGYDLRRLHRAILTSRTYSRSSAAAPGDDGEPIHFSRYAIRRLGAEQLLDAIGRVTETSEKFTSAIPEPYAVLPSDFRSAQVADGSMSTPFLELFGRPSRDTPYESERCARPSPGQALHSINSVHLEGKLAGSGRIARWVKEKTPDDGVIEDLYLAALSRFPAAEERETARSFLAARAAERRAALEDLVWAVINTEEFLTDH